MTNAPPTIRQSFNIFRNYNRLISVAYFLLMLALTGFFGYLLHRKMNEEIALIGAHVTRHGQFFEFVLRSSADHLETFRMSASTAPPEPALPGPTLLTKPPGVWLQENYQSGGFHLDAIPDRDVGGNLVGEGSLKNRDPLFYEDLRTALSLNHKWSSMVFTLPNAAQARLVSIHRFHAILPWQSSEMIPFDPQIYKSPVWVMGQPEHNPDRAKYWAPVYFGGPDRGLLVPVAAPLYHRSRFTGVLSIDISVDYLNRINADFIYPLGLTFLVDQRYTVLTHPHLYAKPLEVSTAPSLVQALPDVLVGEHQRLMQLPPGQAERINGYLVIRYPLISAPWSLFYLTSESALWWKLGANMGAPMIGVLLGLTLLMILTYMLTSREFVGPAAKLVQHIARESNFQAATIPVVPTGWRPWFETVTRAFQESMQLMALRQELDIAASMQQSILPRHWPEHSHYTLWGKMRPAKEIGGDFYDHFRLGEAQGMTVADVSGKGISAGLFGMVSKTLLKAAATQGQLAIGEVLASVNNSLAEDNENCMFVTLFYASLDPASGRLEFVNAGHPPPLVIHADGTVAELPLTRGMALGTMDGIHYASLSVRLLPGDTVLMFSDGVTEAMNAAYEEFGVQRLMALFANQPPEDPQQAVERVFVAVDHFADGFEQSDDITCVALQYRGYSSDLLHLMDRGEEEVA